MYHKKAQKTAWREKVGQYKGRREGRNKSKKKKKGAGTEEGSSSKLSSM